MPDATATWPTPAGSCRANGHPGAIYTEFLMIYTEFLMILRCFLTVCRPFVDRFSTDLGALLSPMYCAKFNMMMFLLKMMKALFKNDDFCI